MEGDPEKAVHLSSALICDANVDGEIKNWARIVRGVSYEKMGKFVRVIEDNGAVMEDPSAGDYQKWIAQGNRGMGYMKRGKQKEP